MVVLMRKILFAITCLTVSLAAVSMFGQQPKPDRTISVVAERFTFSPSKITVKQGQIIEIVLVSDDTDHGFRIPAADIDGAIPQAGKGELRITFAASRKGRYAFECSRACGAGHTLMRGELVVE
jgi:cytochrome c oxidase subunit 2